MKLFLCMGLILIGAWLALLNWQSFYVAFVKMENAPSWIPILAGFLLFSGIYFFPQNPIKHLAWLAFIVDWGSLPGIGHAMYSCWCRRK